VIRIYKPWHQTHSCSRSHMPLRLPGGLPRSKGQTTSNPVLRKRFAVPVSTLEELIHP